jgi:hypothetical protein
LSRQNVDGSSTGCFVRVSLVFVHGVADLQGETDEEEELTWPHSVIAASLCIRLFSNLLDALDVEVDDRSLPETDDTSAR